MGPLEPEKKRLEAEVILKPVSSFTYAEPRGLLPSPLA